MSYNNFRTFISIVDTGSLAETARRLHLSPSAVSKQLALLEQRLGSKLLQRSTRAIQVTDTGERFFRHCINITQAVDAAETEIRDMAGDPSGVIKITLPQVMATEDFASMLQSFTQAQPEISLKLEVSNDAENLIDKDLDIGFRAGSLQDSQLIAVELFESEIVMCASPEYIRQHGTPNDIDGLHKHRLIIPSYVYLPPSLKRAKKSQGSVAFDHHILCDNVSLLINLAKAGAGLAMTWDSLINNELDRKELIQIESPIKHKSRPVSLVYASRNYMPQRMRLFIDHVKQHYQ